MGDGYGQISPDQITNFARDKNKQLEEAFVHLRCSRPMMKIRLKTHVMI